MYENGCCMRICIRTKVMRLMSDRAYAYAYGRLYIYGPLALEIECNGGRLGFPPVARGVYCAG